MCKPKRRKKPARISSGIAIAVAACFAGSLAQANPTAPTVVHGSASFAQAGNILNITNSANAIINWGSFSISVGELTRFIQPSALSAVLNRVTGQDPSAILGALQSNGRVFLINPNGIVFGAGAQIDVAGLVASTLKLSNEDFLNNRMRFTDGAGAGNVLNQGSLTGGSVYLIGKAVTNEGLITSPGGEVILAAGNSVELVSPGTPNLRVEVVAPDNQARNLGTIAADAGRIGIYAGLIRQDGSLRADSAVVEGGRILLKATRNVTLGAASRTSASGISGGRVEIQAGDTSIVEGDITATGSAGAGGTVQLLGNLVGLAGNAQIDTSGETGGGTVLVGGDFQGGNPEVQNAFRTHVGPDVTIKADAIAANDGGRVIVWADDATRFYGSISAQGGATGGDGGFTEVSGKRGLDFQGAVNLGATNGATGTLLLDPDFINITTGGFDFYSGPVLFAALPGTVSLHPAFLDLVAANVLLQANEDINVIHGITLSTPAAGISLQAGRSLNINAGITTRGGAITLISGDPGSLTQPGAGAIFLNAGLDTTGGGAVPAGADILMTATNGAVNIQNSTMLAGSGSVDITAATGITVSATTQPVSITGGNVTLTSGGNVSLPGGAGTGHHVLVSGSDTITVHASGDVAVTGGSGAGAYAKVFGANGVSMTVGGAVHLNDGAGAGSTAFVESGSPTSIYLDFPQIASGGYFVNGIESAIVDPVSGSGFIAGGAQAVLDTNLLVTYNLPPPPPPPPPSSSPPAVPSVSSDASSPAPTSVLPEQALIAAMGQSTEALETGKVRESPGTAKEDREKGLPVCR